MGGSLDLFHGCYCSGSAEITSLVKVAGLWLMPSCLLQVFLQVEIGDADGDNHSYVHSVILLDLYHNLGTVSKCLFNQSFHSFNK